MKRIILLVILGILLLFSFGNRQSSEVLTIINPFPEVADSLKTYANSFEKDTGIKVEVHTPSKDQTVNELMEKMILENNPPDVFPIAGYSDFLLYEDIIYAFQNDKWINETNLEYKQEGIVYGFPITIEGTGIIVNTKYIEELGIDYNTINSSEDFINLVLLLEENKEELGYSAVFGISFEEHSDDMKILLDILFNGNTYEDVYAYFSGYEDALDFTKYPELVDLILSHCDKRNLFAPTEVIEENFANGEYVFMLGTSTVSKTLSEYGMDMQYVDIIPAVYNDLSSDRITIVIPYYWCVNKYGDIDESLLFLNNLVFTSYGQTYLSKDTTFMSPFMGISYAPLKINETVINYYKTKHFSMGYINGSNKHLSEIYETLFLEFYYFRDYTAFTTELENASIVISDSIGKD